MEWLSQYLLKDTGFTTPNWKEICRYVESSSIDTDDTWRRIGEVWLESILADLPEGYRITQSENFLLLTNESDRYIDLFLRYLEKSRRSILRVIPGIAEDDEHGKHIVLIFNDIEHYYTYLSAYYPDDGEFGMSAGIYINAGYGHFAFPHQELSIAEPIAAHEMTHALVSHLPIPTWLNEGIAISVEQELCNSRPLRMDNELYAEHVNFWGESEVQEFWAGKSFQRADEGQSLSYDLAQLAVHSLSQDYEIFKNFVNTAHYSDGGEAAAYTTYGGSLGNLLSQFFGEGNWEPKPASWKFNQSSKK